MLSVLLKIPLPALACHGCWGPAAAPRRGSVNAPVLIDAGSGRRADVV